MSGHTHTHTHGTTSGVEVSPERARRVRLVLAIALAPLVLGTIVGLVLLWPDASDAARDDFVDQPRATYATVPVVQVIEVACPDDGSTLDPDRTCADLVVRLDDGTEARIATPSAVIAAGIGPGDTVQVVELLSADGAGTTYEYVEVDRTGALGWLALAFAVAVVAVARWRGLTALVGLVVAFWVLRSFLLPGLLAGESALAVAVVGSSLIMLVALYVAHGVSLRTTTAVIGTMFGLATTALLGWLATRLATLTGGGGDDERLLAAVAPDVPLRGVLLAGLVLAGLGVLNDVTVTQASAVWELHQADPGVGTRRLTRSAMRIGRDHIASSVYTLVFAYAGAALPLFLLIVVYERPMLEAVSAEAIATEVVSMLVGAIGLVLAVPLTTVVAALVVTAAAPPAGPSAPVTGERRDRTALRG